MMYETIWIPLSDVAVMEPIEQEAEDTNEATDATESSNPVESQNTAAPKKEKRKAERKAKAAVKPEPKKVKEAPMKTTKKPAKKEKTTLIVAKKKGNTLTKSKAKVLSKTKRITAEEKERLTLLALNKAKKPLTRYDVACAITGNSKLTAKEAANVGGINKCCGVPDKKGNFPPTSLAGRGLIKRELASLHDEAGDNRGYVMLITAKGRQAAAKLG
jgi:hypothetical protein